MCSARDALRSSLLAHKLVPGQFEAMREAQRGLCAICHREQTGGRRLCVDHDHRTGAIRSLLCTSCNFVLGHVDDDEQRLLAAVEYLRLHRSA